MLALFPKGPKICRPKALKIDVFDYSMHCRLTHPLQGTPANIPIELVLREAIVIRLHVRCL